MTTLKTITYALERALGDGYLVTADSTEPPTTKLLVRKGEATISARGVIDDPEALVGDKPALANWAREAAHVVKSCFK